MERYNAEDQYIIPPEGGWKERTHYLVEVAFSKFNVIHRSIFFTGFLNAKCGLPGGYNYFPSSSSKLEYHNALYIKCIREIVSKEEIKLTEGSGTPSELMNKGEWRKEDS